MESNRRARGPTRAKGGARRRNHAAKDSAGRPSDQRKGRCYGFTYGRVRGGCAETYLFHILAVPNRGRVAYAAHRARLSVRRLDIYGIFQTRSSAFIRDMIRGPIKKRPDLL